MTLTRSAAWILGTLSLVSLACLLLLYAALTDLWHLCGPQDIWSGSELGKAEWRLAAVSFWVLLGLHLGWLGAAWGGLLRSRRLSG